MPSSKKKLNPFQNRGMDKFKEVYSELEKLRASIAAEEGVSTSDVWFTRGTSQGRDWIPVVVGKTRSSSISSRGLESLSADTRIEKHSSFVSDEIKIGDEEVVSDQDLDEDGDRNRNLEHLCSKASWISVRFEQLVYELQHGTRKALKAVTLFFMIAAAVVDVLIAVVAGVTSSLIARHFRPLWARYLPAAFSQRQQSNDLGLGLPVALCSVNSAPVSSSACISAPTSPRQNQESGASSGSFSGKITSASTPVSPVRSCSTFFSSDKLPESGSPAGSPRSPTIGSPVSRHQQGGSPTHKIRRLQQQIHAEELESGGGGGGGGGAAEVMLIVVVILVGLINTGMLVAIVFASMAWFVFPVARRTVSKPTSRNRAS